MNQQDINNYFSQHWRGCFNQYLFSGINLSKKIQSHEWVLDVGCGTNVFKPLITNLVGIDPAFKQADVMTTIEEFKTEQRFDVAFCLGSINFGNKDTIEHQIRCVIDLLKPQSKIYWRCNPGLHDHGNKECEKLVFFPWSKSLLFNYADEFGYKVVDMRDDLNNRIYCEWNKK